MADLKISQLTALTGAGTASDDLFVIVDTSATQTKKIVLSQAQIALFNGPAFSAFQLTAQSIPTGAFTKLTVNTEEFDTASAYDNSTYRFQPAVAGYYQINGSTGLVSLTATTIALSIYKNGSEYKRGARVATAAAGIDLSVTSLVYLNGTTDYVELFLFQNSAGAVNTDISGGLVANTVTWFNGSLTRF